MVKLFTKPRVLLGLCLLAALLLALGWALHRPPRGADGIVLEEKLVAFPKVQNGWAYDKATLDLGEAKALVLPENARVEPAAGPAAEVFMEKALLYGGRSSTPLSPRLARKYMGCATRRAGDKVVLATFGEWNSFIEGGARMHLLLRVPAGISVERRGGLSGEDSAGHVRERVDGVKSTEVEEGVWFGPVAPAPGWQALPSAPDLDLTAKAAR